VLGLLPLVRSDALHVWLGVGILAVVLGRRPGRTVVGLALSLLPSVLHFVWRHAYYGEWLPNTYFLKVYLNEGLLQLGVDYVRSFGRAYAVPLVLLLVPMLFAPERIRLGLVLGLAVSAAYAVYVGGDVFEHTRYLAHWVPILIVLAFHSAGELVPGQRKPELVLSTLLFIALFFPPGRNTSYAKLTTLNGAPHPGVVAGVLIDRHTRPDSKVGVFAAGMVPYFSHRYCIDFLGKVDRVIARGRPRKRVTNRVWIGHNKYDGAHSFGLLPDVVVVPAVPQTYLETVVTLRDAGWWFQPLPDFMLDVLTTPACVRDYLPHPVPVPYLLENESILIHRSSPDLASIAAWKEPEVVPRHALTLSMLR
jgi:arabinofuranosyltransferase